MLYRIQQIEASKEHLRLALQLNPNHEQAKEIVAFLENGSAQMPASLAGPLAEPPPPSAVRSSKD